MGCYQGKANKPSTAMASNTDTEPASTLLNPTSVQKKEVGGSSANGSEVKDGELPDALEPVTSPQDGSKDWPLRWKALRMFAMADKGPDGLLDARELAGDGSDMKFKDMLQAVCEGDVANSLSQTQWLERVKNLVLRDEMQGAAFLDLCEVHLAERMEHWPLRDDAVQVFRMADRNGNGQLEMKELAEIRRSEEFAQAMMDNIDIDKSGTVSKGEWLAYVKRLADTNEKSAVAVLALYKKHLSNSSNTTEAYDAAKTSMDVLVEDKGIRSTRRCGACC